MKPHTSYPKEFRNAEGKPKRPHPDRRWTLLFIGDHGRVVTLKRFKGFVYSAAFVFLLAACGIVVLFWQNQRISVKNDQLQADLGLLQKRLADLSHEKDILLARLVLADSRIKKNAEEIAPSLPARLPAEEKIEESPEEPKPTKPEISKNAVSTTAIVQQKSQPEALNPSVRVDVENFVLMPLADKRKVKIHYKVKNTSPNSQRVSGSTMVVLKDDSLEFSKWLAIPAMPLVDGKPTGEKRGHEFAINYFKTMRFTADVPPSSAQFNAATVYVFAEDGQLLLEKAFPLELDSQDTSATASPAPLDSVSRPSQDNAAQKTSSAAESEIQGSQSAIPVPLY